MRKTPSFIVHALALAALFTLPAAAPGEGITERTLTGPELYGHIDGGAEIFFEFGFRDLTIRDVARGEKELTTEIYRMESPEGALGVYLLKRGVERPDRSLDARNTVNRYQVTAVRGNVFVQVNNFSGDGTFVENMVGEARRAVGLADYVEPTSVLNLIPVQDRVAGSERLVCGPLSLQSIITLGEGDILLLGGQVYGAAARYDDGVKPAHTLVRIPYPNGTDAAGALDYLEANLDPYLTPLTREPNLFVFRESDGRFGVARRFGRRLDLDLHLAAWNEAR